MVQGLKGLGCAAVSLIAMAAAGVAHAQSQPVTNTDNVTDARDGEDILVTARNTVDASPATIKRRNDAIVDSVTAAQIQSTPDATLADALERIPGVSTEVGYNSTRARYATLRGFDSRYNSTEIDGNLIWNSSRNNRGTQIDIFPAGIASELNVYKTVLPDQDANSIGGHIEVRSLRAFDGGDQPYVNLRASIGGYEQDEAHSPQGGTGPSYRVSGVGKFTFGDDSQFGVVLGGEAQRDVWFSRYNSVTGYSQIGGVDVVNASIFSGIYDNASKTTSLYGKLETRRSNELYAFVSAAYFRDQETDQFFRTGPFLTATKVTDVGDGTGRFTKAVDESYVEDYWVDRKELLLSTGADYRVTDKGTLSFRGAYTDYNHYELDATGEKWQYSTVSGGYDLDRTNPGAVLTTPGVSDPAGWVYRNRAAQEKFLPDDDKVYSLKLDFEQNTFRDARGLGFKGGVYWRRIDRNFDQTVNSFVLPKGVTFDLADALSPGATIDGLNPIFIDSDAYWDKLHAGTLTVDPSATADYHLVEDVYAGHAALYFTTARLRLLAGFRVEATRADDTTGQVTNGVTTPVTNHISYTNFLPNVQAQYDVTPALRLRGSYTQTLARPDFADFAMGQTITLDANGFPSIKGTNPFLEPRTSRNYDASLEFYHGKDYASIGVFRKELQHETFNQLVQTTNSAGTVVLTEQFPLNGGSATLNGAEAAFDVGDLGLIPRAFGKLGLSANATWLDGKWNVVFADGSRRGVDGLRNQPQWLGNVALSYKIGPVSTKLAWRLQGKTFTGTFGTTEAGDIWVGETDRLDLQVRVKVTHGVEVYGDVRNITKSYKARFTGLDDSLWTASSEGRSGFVGVRASY